MKDDNLNITFLFFGQEDFACPISMNNLFLDLFRTHFLSIVSALRIVKKRMKERTEKEGRTSKSLPLEIGKASLTIPTPAKRGKRMKLIA